MDAIQAFNFHKVVMTSSNGHIFRVTDPLWGESTSHKGQWRGALMFSLIYAWTNDGVNNRDAGDLRRHRAHYDVTPMLLPKLSNMVGHQQTLLASKPDIILW